MDPTMMTWIAYGMFHLAWGNWNSANGTSWKHKTVKQKQKQLDKDSNTAHPLSHVNPKSVSHLCCDCVNEIVSEWVMVTVKTCCCVDDDKDDGGDEGGGVNAASVCSADCCHCYAVQSEGRKSIHSFISVIRRVNEQKWCRVPRKGKVKKYPECINPMDLTIRAPKKGKMKKYPECINPMDLTIQTLRRQSQCTVNHWTSK